MFEALRWWCAVLGVVCPREEEEVPLNELSFPELYLLVEWITVEVGGALNAELATIER